MKRVNRVIEEFVGWRTKRGAKPAETYFSVPASDLRRHCGSFYKSLELCFNAALYMRDHHQQTYFTYRRLLHHYWGDLEHPVDAGAGLRARALAGAIEKHQKEKGRKEKTDKTKNKKTKMCLK
jgi:hypothetical protein